MNRRNQINHIRSLQADAEKARKAFIVWFFVCGFIAMSLMGFGIYVVVELLNWVTSK